MQRIAYFGPQGTFTEQAARSFTAGDPVDPDGSVRLVPEQTIPLTLAAVRQGRADAACVPVENTVEGVVAATMDALAVDEPMVATAELLLPIRFSVLVRPGVKAEHVTTVASHPHALAQVRDWLAIHLPHAVAVAATSTAAAAAGVSDGAYDAAVTAPIATRHYPLDVLADDIADVPDALTRFLLLRRPGPPAPPTGRDRTSLVVTAADRTGELASALTELALRGINLSFLQARPLKGLLGKYRFHIDLDGHISEPRIADALLALRRRSPEVRYLGSFAKAGETAAPPEPDHTAADYRAAGEWLTAVLRGEDA